MADQDATRSEGVLEPVRLVPGDDVRSALTALLARRSARAAFVVAGIGSLSRAAIRLAGRDSPLELACDLEVLTLSGSLAPDGVHLHISVSDVEGRVIGGHVSAGCLVRTTLEAMIAWLPQWRFERAMNAATGYRELEIRRQDPG